MRKAIDVMVVLILWPVFSISLFAADDSLVAWWSFDEGGAKAVDCIGQIEDTIHGNFEYADGAAGKALRFDGYTSFISRPAGKVPPLSQAFTIEAWIAPQTYSWNWTGIVDQAGNVVAEELKAEELKLLPGLIGVKFNDPDFTKPDGIDTLEKIDHDWTGGYKDWSARWRGYIKGPFTGEVTFTAEVDNGLMLEIGNKLVIDGWGRDKARTGKITMEKGKLYPIVLSYYQDGDPSYLRLYWSWQGQPKTLIPPSALKYSEKDVEFVKVKELGFKGLPKQRYDRISFGIDYEGHIGLKLMLADQLRQCISDIRVPLLKWSHVAATFDGNTGINLYVNGKNVGSLKVKGTITPEKGHTLYIGRSQKRMSPANTERGPSRKLLSYMVFDGLIDEVKIYNRALSPEQVRQCYEMVTPSREQPLQRRVMPCGPEKANPDFGAAYCRLRYDRQWEKLWRVGPDPDILVVFDESPVRLVFWRGTSYGAAWVAENGKWMGDQSLEATGNSTGWGCAEHMSDKQCRYSHVRLIENHDARVVVHWRYAISDIVYGISRVEEDGWGEWADEYYYIYPDAVSTRKQILHSNILKHEWQETIVLHQPGARPEDDIDLDALTWANMEGESMTYSWATRPERGGPRPKDPTIQVTNLKAKYKPFIIFEPDSGLKLFTCCIEPWSHFPWWNHWPVSLLPNDGRRTPVADRPSHSSLSQSIEDSPVIKYDEEKKTYTAVTLYGMSDKPAEALVPLARSWNYPAQLKLQNDAYRCRGYDKYQRAYVLECKDKGDPAVLKFVLAASEDSPVVNPAFVINDWGRKGAELRINGKRVKRGKRFRYGYRHRLEGSDLVVWIKSESTKPVTILLSPLAD